jgi:hypothetical protein
LPETGKPSSGKVLILSSDDFILVLADTTGNAIMATIATSRIIRNMANLRVYLNSFLRKFIISTY